MSSSQVCPHCGSSDIDVDGARGSSVCTGCGSVLSDQHIVSEVQFAENAAGGTNVVGQFVSSDGLKGSGLSGYHNGMGTESRTVTLQKGKRLLQQLGGQLRLNQHCIDMAFNFYKMCLVGNLSRGRRLPQLMAACLYIVCRTEGTPHMLLDISDLVRVNVYTLGQTYMQISSALCINIPAIDPCLFIHRFAQKMPLGEQRHDVCNTAMRLVGRMKRDWMATGRRPSGLCGAALLVAARMHDFNTNMKDIIKIVKLSETTIRKRLTEFGDTASGALTIDEFQNVDLEEEHDPPCFTKARLKAKLGQFEDEEGLQKMTKELSSIQDEIEHAVESDAPKKKLRGKWAALAKASDAASKKPTPSKKTGKPDLIKSGVAGALVGPGVEREVGDTTDFIADQILQDALSEHPKQEDVCIGASGLPVPQHGTWPTGHLGPRPTAASLGLTASISQSVARPPAQTEKEEESGELDLEGIDDDDLDKYILTPGEIKVKTKIWMNENGDFLQELQEKQEKRAKEEAEKLLKGDKKRRVKKRPRNTGVAQTAGEAMQCMLEDRKLSSKINYDILKTLEEPSTPSGGAGDVLPAEPVLDPLSVSRFSRTSLPHDDMPSPVKQPKLEPKPASKPRARPQANPRAPQIPLLQSPEPSSASPEVKEVKDVKKADENVLVESGPVDYAADEDEGEEEWEEEEEQHYSAAQLLGNTGVEEDEFDDYYS